MSDLIVRDKAIDALDDFQSDIENCVADAYAIARQRMATIPSAEPTWTDVLAELHERFNALEKELRKASAEMSAIIRANLDRPKGEWIPCSERLPEWNTRVLFYLEKECYYDYPEPQYVTDWWIQEGSFNDKYGVFVYDSPDIGKGIPKDCVVAWMPLPKPWKGADDDTD